MIIDYLLFTIELGGNCGLVLTDDGTYKYYYDCENRLTDVNDKATEGWEDKDGDGFPDAIDSGSGGGGGCGSGVGGPGGPGGPGSGGPPADPEP